MKLNIELAGKPRTVELRGLPGGLQCSIDGRAMACDALEITPGVFSILIGAQAFEARMESAGDKALVHIGGREYTVTARDPRQWSRTRALAVEWHGRQQLVAPMPGKIVRVLVKAGESIEAGQGIVVVEAMKMQNEVRSPKSGIVERLLVSEGQTVNAGEVLAFVV
jgi:biotin carboxyl carrier protein